MPRTKKQLAQRREVAKTPTLAKELSAVKAQVEKLRVQCDNMSRTLVRLCCPPEWFKDDIDDAEVLSRMAEVSSFDNWLAKLAPR